jgi:pilus assembly protein FimV
VRKTNVKTWLAALVIALLPCVAGAAGLGRITVLTAIGQPLLAEIELVAVTPQELSSLSARLALPDAYRQANLQYNVALTGARITIEKRSNGQNYLRIVSTRAVTEPFIDLLVELIWAAGRLSREYTALLDPPGIPPLVSAPTVTAAPEARPAPAAPAPAPQPPVAVEPPASPAPIVTAPIVTTPATPAPESATPAAPAPVTAAPVTAAPSVPSPVAVAPVAATPMAAGKEYGPIERGETLGKIARSTMPEGVTLEQMLVALFRTNPDAFIRNNLNLVRAGKILRVPDREEVETTVARDDAIREYRTHVADWNAYRQQLADAAGTVPAEKRAAVSGKITPKVEDKAVRGEPKDVVKLSKGEPSGTAAGKGKSPGTAERIRMLEEEAIARERALAEANSRISQLERTIKDMQKLAELKSPGMAAAQQQAQKPPAPAATAKPAPQPAPAKAEPKPAPAKPEAVAAAKPAPAAAPAPKPQPAAQPKPKPVPATQQREPELMDEILAAASDPLYLGAGGALVLGGLAFWMVRRRRVGAGRSDSPPIAPKLEMAAAGAGAAAVTGDTAEETTARTPAATSIDDVDPLQEAEVYIQYGRDGQAEEILKEALARNPGREDVQLKLLEVYAGRKDKDAFGKVAADLSRRTGGAGGNWLKAAAMGFALDPANQLYEAGQGAATDTVVRPVGTSSDVDLDLGGGGDLPRISTDIMLDAGAVEAATAITDTAIQLPSEAAAGVKKAPAAVMPDFTLEVPSAGAVAQTDVALEPVAPSRGSNVIDFHIDLPKAEEPVTVVSDSEAASAGDAALDFKIEGLDFELERGPQTVPAGGGGGEKDGQWYDVQTKFDLAKAYQEMGDRDGAREILREVVKEGDAEQKAQATKLLESLG